MLKAACAGGDRGRDERHKNWESISHYKPVWEQTALSLRKRKRCRITKKSWSCADRVRKEGHGALAARVARTLLTDWVPEAAQIIAKAFFGAPERQVVPRNRARLERGSFERFL